MSDEVRENNNALQNARLAKEALSVQEAQLRNSKAKGELINRKRAEDHIRALARSEREAIEALPGRMAQALASKIDVSEASILEILEKIVYDHLQSRAGVKVSIDVSL